MIVEIRRAKFWVIAVSMLFILFAQENKRIFAADGVSSQENEVLLLEYDVKVMKNDGSVIQPFSIYYGGLDAKSSDIGKLNSVDVYYTFGKKNRQGPYLFYGAKIKTKDGRGYFEINSPKETWCMVVVFAKSIIESREYNYTAKTSFFIVGKSKFTEAYAKMPDNFGNGLDIRIERENIKEDYTCLRMRNIPIKTSVTFNNKPFFNESVNIFNELNGLKKMMLDKHGVFIFNYPTSQARFVTDGARKLDHDFIVVKHKSGNKVYICSYSVLFDLEAARAKRVDRHNIIYGLSIFGLSALVSLFLTLRFGENKNIA